MEKEEKKDPLRIKYLLDKVKGIVQKYEQISQISGENFNIFKVINLTSDEVRIHSKFIAELLDPKGSHGQKDAFLKLFTKCFGIEDFDTATATVEVEKSLGLTTETEGGRLDIYIKDMAGKTIFIENKIYAGDQHHQMLRYHSEHPTHLLYLTLDGNEPSDDSIGTFEEGIEPLKSGVDFETKSYKDDILNWLEECKKESVDFPLLREGIKHYINLIRYLTGKSTNQLMEKEIMNNIRKSPEDIRAAQAIGEGLVQAKIEIQYNFWKVLTKEFESRGFKMQKNSSPITKQTITNYYKKNSKYYGVSYKIYSYKDLTFFYGIQIENALYYGFELDKGGNFELCEDEEFSSIRESLKALNSKYNSNIWWLGSKFFEDEVNFKEFNTDTVINMADDAYLKKYVQEFVSKAEETIQIFKSILDKEYGAK